MAASIRGRMEMAFAITAFGTLILAAVSIMNMRIVRSSANNANLPVVVAHELREPDAAGSSVTFHYFLRNEGLGPALNLEHGIEVSGRRHSFGDEGSPHKYPTVQRDECVPPKGDEARRIPETSIDVTIQLDEPAPAVPVERAYWCRYRSLHGDLYETHNAFAPNSDLAVHRLRWERTKRALTTPPHIRPRALRR